jgi:hypothetical protein
MKPNLCHLLWERTHTRARGGRKPWACGGGRSSKVMIAAVGEMGRASSVAPGALGTPRLWQSEYG